MICICKWARETIQHYIWIQIEVRNSVFIAVLHFTVTVDSRVSNNEQNSYPKMSLMKQPLVCSWVVLIINTSGDKCYILISPSIRFFFFFFTKLQCNWLPIKAKMNHNSPRHMSQRRRKRDICGKNFLKVVLYVFIFFFWVSFLHMDFFIYKITISFICTYMYNMFIIDKYVLFLMVF
jgi:hypothetical protein